jgi:hypothetical protein
MSSERKQQNKALQSKISINSPSNHLTLVTHNSEKPYERKGNHFIESPENVANYLLVQEMTYINEAIKLAYLSIQKKLTPTAQTPLVNHLKVLHQRITDATEIYQELPNRQEPNEALVFTDLAHRSIREILPAKKDDAILTLSSASDIILLSDIVLQKIDNIGPTKKSVKTITRASEILLEHDIFMQSHRLRFLKKEEELLPLFQSGKKEVFLGFGLLIDIVHEIAQDADTKLPSLPKTITQEPKIIEEDGKELLEITYRVNEDTTISAAHTFRPDPPDLFHSPQERLAHLQKLNVAKQELGITISQQMHDEEIQYTLRVPINSFQEEKSNERRSLT